MESDYRIRFQYFRIPSRYDLPNKGKPALCRLSLYERGKGFKIINKTFPPTSKGGAVFCDILDKGGSLLAQGVADCSYADNFNYKIGREIALGRAKKQLEKETKQ